MPDSATASLPALASHHSLLRTVREVALIALRHVFLPINAIIFTVVALLVVFGQTREGLFLGGIVLLNILLGFVQDLRAWLLLERLQIATALRNIRINADGSESLVESEEIARGDHIRLKLGDQAPCDGVLIESRNLEVNEGLVTGESDSFPRGDGEDVLAGSVVTSGSGVIQVKTSFAGSRMAKMARGLRRYSANPSPIQRSVETIVRYTVYALLAAAAFVVARGILGGEANIRIVEQVGALASVLVPQGLVVAVTLLFTYGAGHFYNRHVLLQEVNATEKFGRVKNLCMDKTGTLTENELTVERFLLPDAAHEGEARELSALYLRHSGDSSQTIRALEAYLAPPPAREVRESLSFSSWRRYGGIALANPVEVRLPQSCGSPTSTKTSDGTVVLVGGPEVFAPYLSGESERAWLSEQAGGAAREGKRVLCVARAHGECVPHALDGTDLSIVGLFVLKNKLREGVRDAVSFFQERGVMIRILSGDHPDTVRAIASSAGITHTDALITGAEMKKWSAADYAERAKNYTLFARIEPEQKERIIDALKQDGFTAMIGDGANDALSVKKADLGIAVYDGAAATRQIAAVVLMHNSFVELPAGVRLADSMIENIEIFASVFMNQTFVQFLFFVILALAGISFPLTPLNVNFMNYFTVGFPALLISFWAINPPERTNPASGRPFLARVLPFPIALSIVQTIAILAIFSFARLSTPAEELGSLLVIGVAVLGFAFLALASEFYSEGLTHTRRMVLCLFGAIEAVMLFAAFKIPLVLFFFGLTLPARADIVAVLLIAAIGSAVQYLLARSYFSLGSLQPAK